MFVDKYREVISWFYWYVPFRNCVFCTLRLCLQGMSSVVKNVNMRFTSFILSRYF